MTVYINGVLVAEAPAVHEATHISGGSDDIDAALNPLAVALTTRGDVLFLNASGLARLAKGAEGTVLTMGANDPAWAAAGGGVTSGLIAMWHGTIANIPAGYVICDGNNSTPNLLTKFVQGVATAATNPGATGGAATHALSTAELASHAHSISISSGTAQTKVKEGGSSETSTQNTASAGSGSAHQNEPTFYDVAFLMKT